MLSHYTDYEGRKRKQTLSRTIWVTAVACLVFGLFNLNLSSWASAAAIFTSAGVCLIALLVNYRNHQTLASILVCLSVLMAITYSVIDGDGLLDPGIVGYPLFVLIGTLLLDKRFTPWLTAAAILSLGLVGLLQAGGYLHLTIHPESASNFLPISIFLITGGLVVWVILDNMQNNYAQLRESANDLHNAYDLTIQGLSRALDTRDVDTGGHSHRVVELAEKLARVLDLPEGELLYLRYGAFLHDVGKIGIPDAILFKPGPLSPEEWAVMRTHTLLAEKMLAGIPYLIPALDIPRCHHEHWDGQGYPAGLQGEAIPLAARIFAVVDVWDALTNDRPYRPAWPTARARAYIADQSAKQFDPRVVSAFLKLIDG